MSVSADKLLHPVTTSAKEQHIEVKPTHGWHANDKDKLYYGAKINIADGIIHTGVVLPTAM